MERSRRTFAASGIVAPVLFVVLVILASALRPGNSQVRQFISELGTGPNAVVMNLNFLAFGLLVTLFAFGIGRATGSRVVLLLFALYGLGAIGAGIFSCDPGCPALGSFHNDMHTSFLSSPSRRWRSRRSGRGGASGRRPLGDRSANSRSWLG